MTDTKSLIDRLRAIVTDIREHTLYDYIGSKASTTFPEIDAACAQAADRLEALTAPAEMETTEAPNADMLAFGAADFACTFYPDDTPEHRLARQAYCDGAAGAAPIIARLAAQLAAEKERHVELQTLAHGWMVAHDMLKAGKPYDLPKPADVPDAIARAEKVEAAWADLRGRVKWRPVSALTDNSPVLVRNDEERGWLPFIAWHGFGKWNRPATADPLPYEPTHFLPLDVMLALLTPSPTAGWSWDFDTPAPPLPRYKEAPMADKQSKNAANARIAELERDINAICDGKLKTLPLILAERRYKKAEAGLADIRELLDDIKTWANSRCPCKNDLPNPCPLCDADANKASDICLAAENTVPKRLLARIDRALLTPSLQGEPKDE